MLGIEKYKPSKHEKLWGIEHWIANNPKYCCKILELNEGYRCSKHYHKLKHETFHILKGRIKLELGDREDILVAGDTVVVEQNVVHRFTGLDSNNIIIEVSTEHFDYDSYRGERSGKVF